MRNLLIGLLTLSSVNTFAFENVLVLTATSRDDGSSEIESIVDDKILVRCNGSRENSNGSLYTNLDGMLHIFNFKNHSAECYQAQDAIKGEVTSMKPVEFVIKHGNVIGIRVHK